MTEMSTFLPIPIFILKFNSKFQTTNFTSPFHLPISPPHFTSPFHVPLSPPHFTSPFHFPLSLPPSISPFHFPISTPHINFIYRYHGAWWYRLTSWKQSNLNGKYYNGTSDRRAYIDGVYWRTISQNHSLKKTEMKLRPQVTKFE